IVLDYASHAIGFNQFHLVVVAAFGGSHHVLNLPPTRPGVADADSLFFGGSLVYVLKIDGTGIEHHVAANIAMHSKLNLSRKRLVDGYGKRGAMMAGEASAGIEFGYD